MTEVSNVRQFGRPGPRPLGDVKDDNTYMEASCTQRHDNFKTIESFRFPDRNSTTLSSEKQLRRLHDADDNFKQSSLIDTVAVANGSFEDVSSKKSESDTVSIEKCAADANANPSLVSAKERTISIPRAQTFTELPDKFSRKKPVFYKHSGTEVNHENSLTNMYKIRSKTCSNLKDSRMASNPNSDYSSVAVLIQKYGKAENKDDNMKQEWYDCPAKVRNAKTLSPQRRCVLMKKLEQRKMTSIPRCDAVDIMDTTQTIQNQIKYEEETKTKEEKPSTTTEFPSLDFDRSTTSPALLLTKQSRPDYIIPGKMKRESTSCSLQSSSRQKMFPETLTTSMPGAIVGQPLKSFIALGRSHTFCYSSRDIMSNGSISLTNMLKESRIASLAIKFQTPSSNGAANDILEKLDILERSDPSKNGEKRNRQREKFPVLSGDRAKRKTQYMSQMGRDIERKFDELQRRISRNLSRNNASENQREETSTMSHDTNTKSFNEYVRQQRSRLRITNITMSRNREKHVTFADQPANKRFVPEESLEAKGLKSMNTISKSSGDLQKVRQSNKSLSASELLRLKRKLIPGESPKPLQTKFELSRDLKISGMRSDDGRNRGIGFVTCIDGKYDSEDECGGLLSEAVRRLSDMAENGEFHSATDRACTHVPKSQGRSSFYPDPDPDPGIQSDDGEGDSSDNSSTAVDAAEINNAEKNIRIINAVDLGSYSDFQHRRFKKPFNCSDNSKTRFLKMKLEN